MNDIPSDPTQNFEDELLAEYAFDYQKAKPNRFAAHNAAQKITIVLDEDVAQVFTNSEAVNKVLRALIEAMPRPDKIA